MNYKNTPFKLKGSPFKQTETKNPTKTNGPGDLLISETTKGDDVIVPGTEIMESVNTDTYDGDGGYASNEDWEKFLATPAGAEYTKKNTKQVGTGVFNPDTTIPGLDKKVDSKVWYTPKGTDEESWEQRSNIRSNKNITGQIKRNDMRNLRQGNVEGADKKTARQEYKDAKKGGDKDVIKNAKDNLNKVKTKFKSEKKTIKGNKRSQRKEFLDQELKNRLNMSKSGNNSKYDMDPRAVTEATSTNITNDRFENFRKNIKPSKFGKLGEPSINMFPTTPFKQDGYNFGANKKNKK